MAMTMIEAVARAIARSTSAKFPDHEGAEWRNFIDRARAAIEAMQKPTEAMIKAAYGSDGVTHTTHDMTEAGDEDQLLDANLLWQAMIDAALREKP